MLFSLNLVTCGVNDTSKILYFCQTDTKNQGNFKLLEYNWRVIFMIQLNTVKSFNMIKISIEFVLGKKYINHMKPERRQSMEYMVYRYNLTLWDIIGIILYIITLYPSPRETIYPCYLLSRQGMESVLLTFCRVEKVVKSKLII